MCKQNGASHEIGGNVFEDCQNRTVCKLAWHFSGLKWMAAICFCFFFFFVGLWTCLNILEQQSKYTDTRGRKWRDGRRALFSSSTRVCVFMLHQLAEMSILQTCERYNRATNRGDKIHFRRPPHSIKTVLSVTTTSFLASMYFLYGPCSCFVFQNFLTWRAQYTGALSFA